MKKILPVIALLFFVSANAQEQKNTIITTDTKTVSQMPGITVTASGNLVYQDSTKFVRKHISRELTLPNALDLLVTISGELIIIKTWNENKVRVETSVRFEGDNELTDEQWLEKAGISLRIFGNTAKLVSNSSGARISSTATYQTIKKETVFWGNGNWHGILPGERQTTLYIPAGSALEIDAKFSALKIQSTIKDLLLYNTNSRVETGDIARLRLRSVQGSFYAGVVSEGDMNMAHGRISLKALEQGTLTGSYNTIEIEKVGSIRVNSTSDEIDINQSNSLSGTKNYGSLRINTSGDLELDGLNSNINLRNISMSAKTIRIFNRHADLRLPVQSVPNYTIEAKGGYNTLYSSFTDKMNVDTLTLKEVTEIKTKTEQLLQTSRMASSSHYSDLMNGMYEIRAKSDQLLETSRTDAELMKNLDVAGTLRTTSSRATSTTGGGAFTYQSSPFTINVNSNPRNNLKYTIKNGDEASRVKFDITCSNCTLDFK